MKGLAGLWPQTLFGRLILVWGVALLLSHAFSYLMTIQVRSRWESNSTQLHIAQEVVTAVRIFERIPASERPAWLPRLGRATHYYHLEMPAVFRIGQPGTAKGLLAHLQRELGPDYVVDELLSPDSQARAALRVHLRDGTSLVVECNKNPGTWFSWPALFFIVQLLLVTAFTWYSVQQATRPLAELSIAAGQLGRALRGTPIPEEGPMEVVQAATAFNSMQDLILEHLKERMQILAAISHDLQTPLTRMRLKTELLADLELRGSLQQDLAGMQALVEEGIAYARTAHGLTETPCRVDLDSLVESLVYDYADAGRNIRRVGQAEDPITTCPHALRRLLTNLLDNSFKFGESVEIHLDDTEPGAVVVAVLDRGPGIPPEHLDTVLQPFRRLETSRNRDTGGTGLGLAIAQQLAQALGSSLVLSNRDGGGLAARLTLSSEWVDRQA